MKGDEDLLPDGSHCHVAETFATAVEFVEGRLKLESKQT